MFLWSMKNANELLELHENSEGSRVRCILDSPLFSGSVIFLIFLANIAIAIFQSAAEFQRFGSINVAFGVVLLMLARGRLMRLERKRYLLNMGVLSYELARLGSELHELKDGPSDPERPGAKNKETVFGSNDFDYKSMKRAEQDLIVFKRETRFMSSIEWGLVLVGTVQWGYGDQALEYLRYWL